MYHSKTTVFLTDNEMIYNRELSWLAFNQRVLQEAQDQTVPLVQRLRFLGIFSNNQDEFIKVRLANLLRLSNLKRKKISKQSGNYSAEELLKLIYKKVTDDQEIFRQTYKDILIQMEHEGIFVVNETQLTKKQKEFCQQYFSTIIAPNVVPLILRKTINMPFLRDNNIYHGVKMCSTKNKKEQAQYAIIQIPVSSSCPRFIQLPSIEGRHDVIFSDDIIRLCLDEIFFMFNYDQISAFTFKLMRDSQLTIDDDISKSLIEKMEIGIENRLHGQPVRLIYDREMPADLLEIIASKLKLKNTENLEAGGRYHLLRDLMKFPKSKISLEIPVSKPIIHHDVQPFSSILKVIDKKDVLLNYPYHTFNHLIDFLREAAIDPKVENIYIALYRVAERSKVINALINAVKNGKKVVVLLELLARFDEEQNVEYAELLQNEGVKVIHGVDGLKVHSKLVLVERKDQSNLKGYVYIGTGNFNENTSQIYSDFGLFTCDLQTVRDTQSIFTFLMNTHKHFTCKRLLVAPYFMRDRFEKMIENEIKNAHKGKKAFIYAKFNSLTDEKMIKLLYKASQEGVEVRLIIRGACGLQPQIDDLSKNIKAISIVDMYLEHARLIIFHNNGENDTYLSSADWMGRNLDRRVEVATPISSPQIKQTLMSFFEIQWSDNVKARNLLSSDTNKELNQSTRQKKIRSQVELYNFYKKMKG